MAKSYFDTGALVKLYVVETGSDFVQKRASKEITITINSLQETELRSAILAAGRRGDISRDAVTKTLAHFDEDIAGGYFTRNTPDWPLLWRRADQLARLHTAHILCRTLDLLHIAAAELSGAKEIITTSPDVQKLAKAVGLQFVKIPESVKRR